MSVSLTARPKKSTCVYNVVGNPIVYHFRRQDYQFDSINNSGGNAQLQFNGVNRTAYFPVGADVFVSRTGYELKGVITASSFSGGNTLITVDVPYNGSGTGYLNNLDNRTDYRVACTVIDQDGEDISPLLEYQPDYTGLVNVDVSNILKSYVYPDWASVTTDAIETGTSKQFKIKYQEYYDGERIKHGRN